jgi:hypothetical protein
MIYYNVKETAELWKISPQMVRRLCLDGRVTGAVLTDKGWIIPDFAEKPDKLDSEAEITLPDFTRKLQSQKRNRKNYHGLYDAVQINLTYSSSRMASNRLTRDQVEHIFKKGKLIGKFEPTKVSDCIEVLNHFLCVDHIIDHAMDPLDVKLIRRLHYLLMYGSVDARLKRVSPGEFRTGPLVQKGRNGVNASEITRELKSLLDDYSGIVQPDLSDILNLHVMFERIAPFRDGNGRVGRLLMFKECLRYGVDPFILHDKKRSVYLDGIKLWDNYRTRKILIDLATDEQEDFKAMVTLCNLRSYNQYYQADIDLKTIE